MYSPMPLILALRIQSQAKFCSRPAWSALRVPGQTGLHCNQVHTGTCYLGQHMFSGHGHYLIQDQRLEQELEPVLQPQAGSGSAVDIAFSLVRRGLPGLGFLCCPEVVPRRPPGPFGRPSGKEVSSLASPTSRPGRLSLSWEKNSTTLSWTLRDRRELLMSLPLSTTVFPTLGASVYPEFTPPLGIEIKLSLKSGFAPSRFRDSTGLATELGSLVLLRLQPNHDPNQRGHTRAGGHRPDLSERACHPVLVLL